MKTPENGQAREQIGANIRDHGYHVYVVSGGPTPRWAYTIGLRPKLGFELVLAGGAGFLKEDVLEILRYVITGAPRDNPAPSIVVPRRGTFMFGPVCREWGSRLLLGAIDYYQEFVESRQLLPDAAHTTIDVPDLSKPLVAETARSWRWLDDVWPFGVSAKSEVMTNLRALMGERVTEAARWEEGYWEAFAGSGEDVRPEDARLVPLGTLLGADPSAEALTRLPVGAATWRDPDGEWQAWRPRG